MVETLQTIGVSTPAMGTFDTRAVARTADGETILYDYNSTLENRRARLEAGKNLYLLFDKDDQYAGVSPNCPTGLMVAPRER